MQEHTASSLVHCVSTGSNHSPRLASAQTIYDRDCIIPAVQLATIDLKVCRSAKSSEPVSLTMIIVLLYLSRRPRRWWRYVLIIATIMPRISTSITIKASIGRWELQEVQGNCDAGKFVPQKRRAATLIDRHSGPMCLYILLDKERSFAICLRWE